jgi:hypothetical protein
VLAQLGERWVGFFGLRPRDEPAADEPDVIVSNLLNGDDQLTVGWLGNKNRSWLTNSDAEGES